MDFLKDGSQKNDCGTMLSAILSPMKKIIYYDIESETVMEAQHVWFDEGMNDLLEKPPNALTVNGNSLCWNFDAANSDRQWTPNSLVLHQIDCRLSYFAFYMHKVDIYGLVIMNFGHGWYR
jgi:hypothetical protein